MTTSHQDFRPFAHAFFVLLRHWRFLGLATGVALVFALVYALLLPNWYMASSTFLPPARQAGLLERLAGGMSSTLRSIGFSGLSGGDAGYNSVSILESRRIGELIVEEFDLMKVYEIEDGSMEKVLRRLKDNTAFDFEKDGMVTIAVWDRDPQRAADMANAYFRHLNEISSSMNATEARTNREFVELQYTSIHDSLALLEERFVAFQKKTKMYALPEQTEASLKAAGETYAELSKMKVLLTMLEQRLGPEDPDVRNLRTMTREMEKQIPGMTGNTTIGLMGSSTEKLPDEALEYMRMYRDIETLSKLSAFMLPIYQQAVLDEQKQMSVLVPLDEAKVPERKDRPKRSIIILVITFSVLVLAILFVLLRERFLQYREDHRDEWELVRRSMRLSRKA